MTSSQSIDDSALEPNQTLEQVDKHKLIVSVPQFSPNINCWVDFGNKIVCKYYKNEQEVQFQTCPECTDISEKYPGTNGLVKFICGNIHQIPQRVLPSDCEFKMEFIQ